MTKTFFDEIQLQNIIFIDINHVFDSYSNFAQSGINIGIAPIGLIDRLAISTELQCKKIVVLGQRFPTTILMNGLVIKPK